MSSHNWSSESLNISLVQRSKSPNLRPVSLCVRLLALWLAAFWLPMTMHCQLASLRLCCVAGSCCETGACGEEPGACQDPTCCGDSSDCQSRACKVVESGKYFLKRALSVKPVLTTDRIDSPVPPDSRRLPPPGVTLNANTGAPPGWIRTWQFVCRAAAKPRAPSARCC